MTPKATLRFLHTADWHLGKKLNRFSRLEEQKAVLAELTKIADQYEVDGMLVAGDVFDSRNPSAEAKGLLTASLLALSKGGERPVLVIAGNHDSPELFEALASWGAPLGILLLGDLTQDLHALQGSFGKGFTLEVLEKGLIALSGSSWPFRCQFLLSPYMSPIRREGKEVASFWQDCWAAALQKASPEEPLVLLAHPYVRYDTADGSEELEEDLEERVLGGQEALSLGAFPEGLAYAALGHIHYPKLLRHEPYPVAYAGSLLQYSFGDRCIEKKALLVEVPRAGAAQVSFLPEGKGLNGGLPLLSFEVTSPEEAQEKCQTHPQAYLELVWAAPQAPSPELRRHLESLHPRLVHFLLKRISFSGGAPDAEVLAQMDQLDWLPLFEAFYEARKGHKPDETIKSIFKEVLNRALAKKSSQDYADTQ